MKDINKTNYNEINKLNNEVKSLNKKLNNLLNMHTIKFKQDLDVREGVIYKGTVKEIIEYGAWVEITPTTKGLLHISEISWEYVNNVEDVLKLGYNRAGRIIDELEAVLVLGAFYVSKARKVLIKNEIELKELLSKLEKK